MNNKLKYLIYVFTLFVFSLFVTLNLIKFYEDKRIGTILNSHTNKLETYYDILSYNQTNTADVIFKETVQNKKFLELYEKALEAKTNKNTETLNLIREEVKSLLDEKYLLYKEKGVLQYHMVFPDNIVFLRMHKPSKFGDDLSSIRSDFNYSNRSLKTVRGFAQGRTAHAFRNVYPLINDQNKHLGAMEISFSSELIQNYFTNINKIHTHFLVRKDIFDSHAWKRDDLILKYQQSSEHENYMMTMTVDHSVEKCITQNKLRIEPNKETIIKLMDQEEKFSVYSLFEDKARVASFFPIFHNITKEPVAWIVSYLHDPLIDETLQISFIFSLCVFVVLSIIFSFIYFLLIQKDILKSVVNEKTKHLLVLNKELEESEHELQIINESLEHKIQEEVNKSRQKDKILFEQTKMAALGEMIGNIAHQWRQPLSVISTSASGMILQNELDILEKEKINEYGENINKNAQYLSKTIDDFRNFIRGNSFKESFNLKESVNSFLSLVESHIKKHQICVDVQIQDGLTVCTFKNELNQCLLNLFNNSKDALVENKIDKKYIKISAHIKNNHLFISFEDNGGGIDESILDKIFEPYFTTKHQSVGTGLGLNMTYRLVVESMHGSISVSNENLEYDGKMYSGALFLIEIPL